MFGNTFQNNPETYAVRMKPKYYNYLVAFSRYKNTAGLCHTCII